MIAHLVAANPWLAIPLCVAVSGVVFPVLGTVVYSFAIGIGDTLWGEPPTSSLLGRFARFFPAYTLGRWIVSP